MSEQERSENQGVEGADGASAQQGGLTRRKAILGAAALAATAGGGYAIYDQLTRAMEATGGATPIIASSVIEPPVTDGIVALTFADYPELLEPGKVFSIRVPKNYPHKWTLVWREPGESGRWMAIGQECTHAGCAVELKESRDGFYCHCHNSHFSAAGDPKRGPALNPLDPVEIAATAEGITFSVMAPKA